MDILKWFIGLAGNFLGHYKIDKFSNIAIAIEDLFIRGLFSLSHFL